MKFYKTAILFFAALIFSSKLYAQQNAADSLMNILGTVGGQEKVKILNELADIYQYINTKESIRLAEEGIKLASKIGYDKGLAGCYGSLGYAYTNVDNQKAIEYTTKALEIRKKINDEAGIATSLNVLGIIKYYEDDYLASIEYHLEALKRREAIGDEIKIATSYNNIAIVNMALSNYDSALDYLNRALKIRVAANNQSAIGIIKANIGEIQKLKGNNEEALETFNEALVINKKLDNHKSIANIFRNIAAVYNNLENYSAAITFYDSSLSIYYTIDEKNGIANSENGLAEVYNNLGQLDSAIKHSTTALEFSQKINSKKNALKALEILYNCYEQKGNFKKAYENLSIYNHINESFKDSDRLKKIARIELEYKLEKIQKEQEDALNRQRIIILLLVLIVLSGTIILILMSRSSKNKKKANIQLNQLNERLNEASAAKDRFLSIIAHDLRGPYQTTLGFSEVLANDFNSLSKHEINECIANLNTSLKNQYNLLNDLLHWAELQGGGFNLETELIDLQLCTNNIISLMTLAAKKKGINLSNSINAGIFVSADKNMLNLVLRNLISNSIKFTPPKGSVNISASENEKSIQICVTDTGIGISNNDISSLFNGESRFSNNGTSDEEGSGLGLILCKEIIEKHGGKIWVESEVNKGSKFIFKLPKSSASN